MESAGQALIQVPQEKQSGTFFFFLKIAHIASEGQLSMQASHKVQVL